MSCVVCHVKVHGRYANDLTRPTSGRLGAGFLPAAGKGITLMRGVERCVFPLG